MTDAASVLSDRIFRARQRFRAEHGVDPDTLLLCPRDADLVVIDTTAMEAYRMGLVVETRIDGPRVFGMKLFSTRDLPAGHVGVSREGCDDQLVIGPRK